MKIYYNLQDKTLFDFLVDQHELFIKALGKIFIINGPSSTGKTTFVNRINGGYFVATK